MVSGVCEFFFPEIIPFCSSHLWDITKKYKILGKYEASAYFLIKINIYPSKNVRENYLYTITMRLICSNWAMLALFALVTE